ncbi:MAG: polysaccharide deacetylase family protein [Pseudomonadota bacterium]|nr:polysaccharide deacetylase family protein [Pseudomonadota bacterium]
MADRTTSGVRIDRLVTLGVVAPLRSCLARERSPRHFKILMYHGVSERTDSQRHPYFRTVTTPAAFRAQMEFLRAGNHRVMTLGDALRWKRSPMQAAADGAAGSAGDERAPVVVTFDDGLRDFHSAAFPILAELGLPATVFLTTDHLGGKFITGEECLTNGEVVELAAQGVEFGSHTVSHPQLATLGDGAVRQELEGSRKAIEDILGRPIDLFSYPYRFPEEDRAFVGRLGAALRAAGYSAGVTTSIGRASVDADPLFLRRLPVNDADDLSLFKAKLDGDYDWLHRLQLTRKRVRRLLQPKAPAPAARHATEEVQ